MQLTTLPQDFSSFYAIIYIYVYKVYFFPFLLSPFFPGGTSTKPLGVELEVLLYIPEQEEKAEDGTRRVLASITQGLFFTF